MLPNINRKDAYKGDDPKGNFHEESLYYGTDSRTGKYQVINQKPGPYYSPEQAKKTNKVSSGGGGTIDADKEQEQYLNIIGSAHSHPSGVHKNQKSKGVTEFTGKNLTKNHWPSATDVRKANDLYHDPTLVGFKGLHFVASPGTNKIGIFHGLQTPVKGERNVKPLATMDLNKFIGKER